MAARQYAICSCSELANNQSITILTHYTMKPYSAAFLDRGSEMAFFLWFKTPRATQYQLKISCRKLWEKIWFERSAGNLYQIRHQRIKWSCNTNDSLNSSSYGWNGCYVCDSVKSSCPGQMSPISQTTFSNELSWMKSFVFRFKFHWSLFQWVQLTISQHWFRQCPITNASQRAHSAQPHTDVEIMKFLVLSFLDEILSNLFVYVNILAITVQQVCSNKTLLVWSIWPNYPKLSTKHPAMGLGVSCGSQWQRFIFSPNHKIPNLVCWGGQCGDNFMKEVCGLPQGWFTIRGKSVK